MNSIKHTCEVARLAHDLGIFLSAEIVESEVFDLAGEPGRLERCAMREALICDEFYADAEGDIRAIVGDETACTGIYLPMSKLLTAKEFDVSFGLHADEMYEALCGEALFNGVKF